MNYFIFKKITKLSNGISRPEWFLFFVLFFLVGCWIDHHLLFLPAKLRLIVFAVTTFSSSFSDVRPWLRRIVPVYMFDFLWNFFYFSLSYFEIIKERIRGVTIPLVYHCSKSSVNNYHRPVSLLQPTSFPRSPFLFFVSYHQNMLSIAYVSS